MPQLRISADGLALCVVYASGAELPIHPLWLRERCTDALNLDPVTQQRLFNPSDIDAHLHISLIQQIDAANFVIAFSDGATAPFAAADILAELPSHETPIEPAPLPWDTRSAQPEPIDWAACEHAQIRLGVLQNFLAHGYVIFNNVPSRPGAVLDVARRFGFPRETNFGVLFDVRSVPAATDLAYTPLPLDPHTDNPYRHPVPGIQLLHCLTNETPGGLSTLVDGLAVAEALRADAPEAFASLSETPVRFRYIDRNTELEASAPIIELDTSGAFAAIHYSPRLDFVPLLPHKQLDQFFAARRRLDHMLRSSTFERRFRLEDGDLMMFDNARLLHGRTGFDPQAGLRHLQGCYIDSDGPRSEYRVLRRQFS
jgi:gamma-butyrobetaine dioxygenase